MIKKVLMRLLSALPFDVMIKIGIVLWIIGSVTFLILLIHACIVVAKLN